jgi:hypothetical protein
MTIPDTKATKNCGPEKISDASWGVTYPSVIIGACANNQHPCQSMFVTGNIKFSSI